MADLTRDEVKSLARKVGVHYPVTYDAMTRLVNAALAARSSAWWTLVMGAAASIEDAANCLRDADAKKQADGAAKHYREAAQKLMAAARVTLDGGKSNDLTKEQHKALAAGVDKVLLPLVRGVLVEKLPQVAAFMLDELTTPPAWKTVERDGYPRYDPDTTYIGINSAGFACCFTRADVSEGDDACWMHTAEESIRMMSGLRWWRVLDRPAVSDALA